MTESAKKAVFKERSLDLKNCLRKIESALDEYRLTIRAEFGYDFDLYDPQTKQVIEIKQER